MMEKGKERDDKWRGNALRRRMKEKDEAERKAEPEGNKERKGEGERGIKKTIVCLANSVRPKGRCIAGREFDGSTFGRWIRPVDPANERAISPNELDPRLSVGDILEFGVTGEFPEGHQRENYVAVAPRFWRRRERLGWNQLLDAVENPGSLWANGYHRNNDRVPIGRLEKGVDRSLYLIRSEDVRIKWDPHKYKRKRVEFCMHGEEYDLAVTDPSEAWYRYKAIWADRNGKVISGWHIREALLCISLAQPFEGYAYKLAAAIITPEQVGP